MNIAQKEPSDPGLDPIIGLARAAADSGWFKGVEPIGDLNDRKVALDYLMRGTKRSADELNAAAAQFVAHQNQQQEQKTMSLSETLREVTTLWETLYGRPVKAQFLNMTKPSENGKPNVAVLITGLRPNQPPLPETLKAQRTPPQPIAPEAKPANAGDAKKIPG